jgi:hypothetical protein
MTYSDRIQQCTYTSPSGKIFNLSNVKTQEYSFRHSIKEHTIIDTENNDLSSQNYTETNKYKQYTEDFGIEASNIPLEVIFSGDDHDTESDNFINALTEISVGSKCGKLQMNYGRSIKVVVIDVSVKRNTVENRASTTVTVNFIEQHLDVPYSTKLMNKKNILKDNIQDKKAVNVSNFTTLMNKIKSIDPTAMKNIINNIQNKIIKLANIYSDVKDGNFTAILRDIQVELSNGDFDFGILGEQIVNLIDTGLTLARSVEFIILYLGEIFNVSNMQMGTTKEDFIINDFFTQTQLLGCCENVLDLNIELKAEAINLAKTIQDDYTDYKTYQQEKSNNFSLILPDITESIQNTCGLLLDLDGLKTSLYVILSKELDPINLCFIYYQNKFRNNPEETINYFQRTNNLQGEEFFLIKQGKEVVFYV